MHATENESLAFFRSMYGGPEGEQRESFAADLAKAEAWKEAETEAGRLRVRWVEDTDYDIAGSIDFGDTPEGKAAEAEYYRKANSGIIYFYGCIVETKCSACGQWEQKASLWGIDFDNSTDETARNSRNYHRLVEAELCLEAMP